MWRASRLLLSAATLRAAAADPPLDLTVLSWNVHWQCGSDHLPGCRAAATARVAELADAHGATVVVAIELEHNDTAPIDLPAHGLGGGHYPAWLQVNGSCPGAAGGAPGDAIALAFKPYVGLGPGWSPVVKSYAAGQPVYAAGGGCLGGDGGGPDPWDKADSRAFAVALLKPPSPGVAGCEAGLCVIALHSPHVDITKGADTIAEVCGEARHQCTVAVGDWNAPISKRSFCNFTVSDRWGQLLGDEHPTTLIGAPDENTCCFPESK